MLRVFVSVIEVIKPFHFPPSLFISRTFSSTFPSCSPFAIFYLFNHLISICFHHLFIFLFVSPRGDNPLEVNVNVYTVV